MAYIIEIQTPEGVADTHYVRTLAGVRDFVSSHTLYDVHIQGKITQLSPNRSIMLQYGGQIVWEWIAADGEFETIYVACDSDTTERHIKKVIG